MYSPNLLHGVGVEALWFVRSNIGVVLRYGAALALVETLIWILLPQAENFLLPVISTVLTAAFAVSLHRRILTEDARFPPRTDGRLLLFILVGLAQSFGVGLLAAGIGLGIVFSFRGGVGIASGVVLFAACFAAILWFLSRTLMFFPHLAVTPTGSVQLGSVWQMSHDLTASIAIRLAVFSGATMAVFTVLGMATSTLFTETTIERRLVSSLPYFLESVLIYLVTACFVALASLIYRRAINEIDGTLS